jgi:hypothetical protein
MVCGSALGGQVISRTGRYKLLTVGGLTIATLGLFLMSTMSSGSSQITGMQYMALLGFGLGLSFPTLVLATQNAVPHDMMGLTTSLNQFARSVGGTIGVAIMGSILTRRLNDELASGLPPRVAEEGPPQLIDALQNPRVLLDDGALQRLRDEGFGAVFGADGGALFEQSLSSMKTGLANSITEVFLFAAILAAIAVVISLFLREERLQTSYEAAAARERADETTGPGPSVRAPAPRAPLERPSVDLRDGAP